MVAAAETTTFESQTLQGPRLEHVTMKGESVDLDIERAQLAQDRMTPQEKIADAIERQEKLIKGSEKQLEELNRINPFFDGGTIKASTLLLEQQREHLENLKQAAHRIQQIEEHKSEIRAEIESLRAQGATDIADRMERHINSLDKQAAELAKMQPLVTSESYQECIADALQSLSRTDTFLGGSIKTLEVVRDVCRSIAQTTGYAIGGSIGAATASMLFDICETAGYMISATSMGMSPKDIEAAITERLIDMTIEAIASGTAGLGSPLGSELKHAVKSDIRKKLVELGSKGVMALIGGALEGLMIQGHDFLKATEDFKKSIAGQDLSREEKANLWRTYCEKHNLTYEALAAKAATCAVDRMISTVGGDLLKNATIMKQLEELLADKLTKLMKASRVEVVAKMGSAAIPNTASEAVGETLHQTLDYWFLESNNPMEIFEAMVKGVAKGLGEGPLRCP